MDSIETSLLRKADLRGEMGIRSAAGHHHQQLLHQQNPFPAFSLEEVDAYAPADRSGPLWENFSVDDLLDLGSGMDECCGDVEDLLGSEDAEEEDEEEGEGEGSPNNSNPSPPSVLSFQAPPPSADLILPAGDAAELEWVSRFVDDSYSEFPSSSMPPPFHHHNRPAAALPAVAAKGEAPKARLTSSRTPLKRSWGSCGFFADSLVVPSKARSKRCRSGGRVWSLRPPFLAESSSSSCSAASSASSCSASSSFSSLSPILLCPVKLQLQQPLQLQDKKKRGRKPKPPAGTPAVAGCGEQHQARRRCSHCGVDRTPQWRAGPMGAKTLCNACGVRYKSGRLLPEYRPAGSPTFLSHLHSNSHRKVLEMRRNKELPAAASPLLAPAASSASASCSAPPTLPAATTAQLYGVV